jgi:hypothetical protein
MVICVQLRTTVMLSLYLMLLASRFDDYLSIMQLVPDRRGGKGELILLAPPTANIPSEMASHKNSDRYTLLICAMQRMRGRQYLADGAISARQLTEDGRHYLSSDENAWHILAVDDQESVVGCARYLPHEKGIPFSELSLSQASLANSPQWGSLFKKLVEAEMSMASKRRVDFVEVGGWALAPQVRNTADALRIALATYSLARILGGCIGIGAVTERHMSSSILRRLGGKTLGWQGVELPSYFDSNYGCQMEILRFESAQPNPRFEVWIDLLRQYLLTAEVLSTDNFFKDAMPVHDDQHDTNHAWWNHAEPHLA